MTDPKKGDLIFWKSGNIYTHVARVYAVHNGLFATWGASVSKGSPTVYGMRGNTPILDIETANKWGIGTGKIAGFVTLNP
jgi:hypothetical protein